MRRLVALTVPLCAALLAGSLVGAAHADPAGPALTVPVAQLDSALICPTAFANAEHNAVLLVHGTTQTSAESWGWNYLKVLPTVGFDTCAVELPGRALGDMQISTEYVVHAVRTLAARTGRQVDVIGHSQGGEELRWAIKWWPDVRASIEHYIGVASPDQGDVNFNVMCANACWASAWQERYGAAFMRALNRGDQTPGAIAYTSIYTRTDQFVQPEIPLWHMSGMRGGRNVAVQDICPGRVVEHLGMLADAVVFALAHDALTHPGATADPRRVGRRVCTQLLMPGVDLADFVAMYTTFFTATAPAAFQTGQVTAEPQLAAYAQ